MAGVDLRRVAFRQLHDDSMTKSPLFIILTLLAVPACQSTMDQQMIKDQDAQLATLTSDRARNQAQLDRVKRENQTLAEQIAFEQSRNTELQQRVSAAEAAMSAKDAETNQLNTSFQGLNVDVGRRGGYIVLGMSSELTFSSGKAELSKQGRETLTKVGDVLKSDYAGRTLWVEGHTDNEQPKKSGWKNNLALSANRAMSVADFLIADLGLDPNYVRVAGYGEYAPKEANDTPEGRAKNRRVEILILE